MKITKTVELSVEDARKLLVDDIHETLVNDPNYFKEIIGEVGFDDGFYGPVNKMSDEEVADRVGEANLGENIAKEHDAQIVTVRLNSLKAYVIYDAQDSGCHGEDVAEAAA